VLQSLDQIFIDIRLVLLKVLIKVTWQVFIYNACTIMRHCRVYDYATLSK